MVKLPAIHRPPPALQRLPVNVLFFRLVDAELPAHPSPPPPHQSGHPGPGSNWAPPLLLLPATFPAPAVYSIPARHLEEAESFPSPTLKGPVRCPRPGPMV
ncbi:hypothetical protein HPP92_028314 [Vanilla planifolia]|uniref:Uncharacterized protein n=1 Tax=Vanilla planifolia TaxID=51239 RepID=A0A835P893_VANPL|nr:hypothetical protein HPP92_028314 [Vanilla planifolia]KAG0447552.1 hypothetical protein HPP92_028283 [Vanilla planifolia]